MNKLIIRHLGRQDYVKTWEAMRHFTLTRTRETNDELWIVEHPSVFTQGQAGRPEHVLLAGDIPVVQTDRGGQVTYHGPGQLVIYFLIDLPRKHLRIRAFVHFIEKAVIQMLSDDGVVAHAKVDAPGIYVDDAKIGSIGLKIKKGCSYHGLALNVDMDLSPFSRINPCGFKNLKMTQVRTVAPRATLANVEEKICRYFAEELTYDNILFT
jgi:lipoyl(octanoyl) transferase